MYAKAYIKGKKGTCFHSHTVPKCTPHARPHRSSCPVVSWHAGVRSFFLNDSDNVPNFSVSLGATRGLSIMVEIATSAISRSRRKEKITPPERIFFLHVLIPSLIFRARANEGTREEKAVPSFSRGPGGTPIPPGGWP